MTTQHYEEWQKNETDRIHRQTKIKEAAQQLQNKQMYGTDCREPCVVKNKKQDN